jgi:hypothetical protein
MSIQDKKEKLKKLQENLKNPKLKEYWGMFEKGIKKLESEMDESVNEEKVYIDFLNKKKGFKQDRIRFNSYEDAVKWGKKNFEKFNPDMIKYESVNEDTKKRFDVDFYKANGDRQTSQEEIIRGDKFSDIVSQATKVAKSKGMNYVEFYYKDSFIGSIDKSNGYEFKKGRDSEKSPLSINEAKPKATAKAKPKAQGKTRGRKKTTLSLADAEKQLAKKVGKTEEECEDIIKQFKELRAKKKARIKKTSETKAKSKAQGETEKSGEITPEAVIERATEKVEKKIDKKIEKVEAQAEKTEKPKANATPEAIKEAEKKVEEKVEKVTKEVAKDSVDALDGMVKAIMDSLKKYDKATAKLSLIKLRDIIDKEIAKYGDGGKVKRETFNFLNELYNLKDEGVTQVQLNGFNESIGYVIGLRLNDTEIEKVGNNAYITLYKKGGSTYAEGGKMMEGKEILSFSFNTDNVTQKEIVEIVENYTKDWRTSGDISNVSMFVTLPKSKANELAMDLKMEDVYDIERNESRYAKGGEIKVGDKVTLSEIKMPNGNVQFERVENGTIKAIDSNGIYDVHNHKTNRIHRVSKDQIESTYAEGGEIKENSIYFIDWTNKKPLLADLRKKYLLDSISFSFRVDNVLRDAINNRHLYDLVIIKGNEGYDAFKYNPDTFNPYNFGGTKMFAKGGSMASGGVGEWKIGDKFRVLKGIYGDYNSPRYANQEFEVINIRDGKYIDAINKRGNTETFDSKNIEKISFADGGGVKRENDYLMGYEPYFEKNVSIASIDEESKTIRPTHGYFPNHPHSKKAIAWAKRNGYKYIADGKTYQGGGELDEVFDDYFNYNIGGAIAMLGQAKEVAPETMGTADSYVANKIKNQQKMDDWWNTPPNQRMAEGGKVSREFATKEIPMYLYKSFFSDSDGDGVPNVDDVEPLNANERERLEEVSLSDEMKTIINYRNDFEKVRKEVVDDLGIIITECGGKGECTILSRTKTPYSIINKLRRRSLTNVKDLNLLDKEAKNKLKNKDLTGLDLYKGLTDVVGTMIVTPDKKNLDKVRDAIKSGKVGEVLEFEDFYANPNNGYRAYHFLISVKKDGVDFPVEIQVKTSRVKKLSDFAHTLYKTGNLNPSGFDKLNKMALESDMGDEEKAKEFDALISNQNKVIELISNQKMAQGGELESVNEDWEVKNGEVLLNGEVIGYYEFDRDSDAFWVDNMKGRGSLGFETKKEVENYFKKNRKYEKAMKPKAVNEAKTYKKGGGLYDNLKIKKGTFTSKAENRGMTAKAFMKEVLSNPENYTLKTRRQAQLMKNMMS